MTTEIAVMNRRAVILAADSAGTITSVVNGAPETRYTKSENKVFQLSELEPIGLMIYGNSSLAQVPWDICIKQYRKFSAGQRYDSAIKYAEEFFNFININQLFFPEEVRIASFKARLGEIVRLVGNEIARRADIGNQQIISTENHRFSERLSNYLNEIEMMDTIKGFDDVLISAVYDQIKGDYIAACKAIFPKEEDQLVIRGSEQGLFRAAFLLAFRRPDMGVSPTGVVVAGYGDQEIFPSVHEFNVSGFLGHKLSWVSKKSEKATVDKPGSILSFASKDMVDTFAYGVGTDAFLNVQDAYSRSVAEIAREILGSAGQASDDAAVGRWVEKAKASFNDDWVPKTMAAHSGPLANVISSLSIEEMASLAETLVALESLKEKMTRPTETVGGPVDVAAITKSEGLVWIKRKLFFDAALNPRYTARQAGLSGGEKRR